MWTFQALGKGIRTTRYPSAPDDSTGITPGRPVPTPLPQGQGHLGAALAAICPSGALKACADLVDVDLSRCIHCQRCRHAVPLAMRWEDDFAWALRTPNGPEPEGAFRRSLHVRVVDAGDGGETLREVRQLTSPYYAVHRLGIFFTPTPRNADVLLVVGPVTQGTRKALLDTFEAMPEPKWVMAVGSAAATGAPFGPSFTASDGVRAVLPVDIAVPGDPPPPLAIMNGLLTLMGRKSSSSPREAVR